MRKSKELIILAVLLLCAMAGVLGYVIIRRAHQSARPAAHPVEPLPPPVNSDGQTPRR